MEDTQMNGKAFESSYIEDIPMVTQKVESVKRQLKMSVEATQNFLKQHPVACIVGAAAVGFIAGALLDRALATFED